MAISRYIRPRNWPMLWGLHLTNLPKRKYPEPPAGTRFKCGWCRKMFMPTSSQYRRTSSERDKPTCSQRCAGLRGAAVTKARHRQRDCSLQVLARQQVQRALLSGELVRPAICEKCGGKPGNNSRGRSNLQAHHWRGYHRRLSVEWLCPKCHGETDSHKHHRGEQCHQAKLTRRSVRLIRKELASGGSVTVLARRFSVSLTSIKRVRNRDVWRHV